MEKWIHHSYDSSPFSEKVRLIFGISNLQRHSVIIPTYLPEPDLLGFTGRLDVGHVRDENSEMINEMARVNCRLIDYSFRFI